MSEPVDPKIEPIRKIVDSPVSTPTASYVNQNTNAGQVLDSDGIDIESLFAPPEKPGELGRLGHFRILKKLGAGGMGMVLLAEDINLLRPVALKIMLPRHARNEQARERFLREARTAARIHHDHVVTIHHVGQDRDIPFIAMEFLQGAPLDGYLKEKKSVSLAAAMRIGREVAEGLQAAHAKGLIHRDIKPANIWLEAPKGRVKILDFGLARDSGEEAKLTHSGAVIGTPSYMSPEQAAGMEVDQRTDLFSLGVVLFELVTGRLPFTGPHTIAVLKALSFDPHPSISGINPQVSPGLINLVDRLLAKKPEDRPNSAAEVVQALLELERPAARPDGKPAVEVVYVPMATSAVADPFADIDATDSEMKDSPPFSRDSESSESRAKSPAPRKRVESLTSEGSTRLRDVARQGKRPRWFIPTGIAALLGAIVLAITLLPGKKPTPTDSEVKKEEPKIALNTETDPPKKDVPKIEVQQPIVHGQETTYDLGNGVKLEMIKINAKGKTFMMGSPKKEPNRAAFQTFDPEDQHEVTFGHDFSMGKYEVTQEQYEAIMGKNPSQFKGPKRPVERVLWNDAQDFIKKLNDRMKGNAKFRLPSEAEWEYACRAGTTTAYNTGNSLTSDDAHFGVTIDVGTKLVGIYKPNKFGLYDMHGNVAEWCEDYYGDYKNAPKNGTAQRSIQSNDYRALRGGVWNYFVRDCRSACRYISTADISSFNFGFRLVASQDEPIEINKADPLLPPITKGDETTYDLGNGVKLEMIKINAKGKKFLMGSPKEEEGRPNGDFEEQHEITFGHDFSIGKYEVTQEQYEAIMGYNPAQFKGVNRPVEKVLWNDAQEFIRKLNEKVKGKAKFRLPSEAEWEYACRAGTTTPFHFGKELNGKQANCDGNTPYGTAEKGPYLKETTSVGTYKPNDFGLYDMHGNVFEWCEDYWGLYKIAPTDGTAQKVKTPNDNRVLRGGTWFIPPQYCRSALRFIITPLIRVEGIGFRVVATQDEPIEVKKADPPAQPITKGE